MIEFDTDNGIVTLDPNKITVLFGPTGIGKTTLLRQLAGHINLAGELLFNDMVIHSINQTTRPELRNFGYLSQKNNLVGTLSVRQHLDLAVSCAKSSVSKEQIDYFIDMMEIRSLLSRQAQTLSGGETQLVSFCLMLVRHSQWLLMDEPLSAVDKGRQSRVLMRFRRWHMEHKIPVLYVTHDVNEMAMIAEDVLLLSSESEPVVADYNELIKQVDSDFVTHYRTVNMIETRWLRSEGNLQALSIEGVDDCTIWAQGSAPSERQQWITVPLSEISISRYKMPDSSILNQLDGVIQSIGHEHDGFCYLSILVGKQVLAARITDKSREDLKLSEGSMCVVCFKTTQLMPD